ncbi:MAG: TolC family protein, partial [Alistipes sp.]
MRKLVLFLGLIAFGMTASAQQSADVLNLTLEQALEIALSENPTIKIADQEIEIKRYAKQGTYASLYPQIDATAQYQRVIEKQTMSMDFGGQTQSIKVGSDNSFNGGLTASMPIINAQLWTSLKVSALDVELAVEKARSSRLDMVEQVTKAYYSVLLAKESYNVYKRVYDNAVENNKNVKKKYDVGSVSEYDLITSNVSVQNAIPNLFEAENSITLTLWQLKALLGLDLSRNIDVVGSLMDYEQTMNYGYELSQLNLEDNSTMKQLDLQTEQLQKALRLTKMANVPTLSVNAAYLYTALGNDGKFFVRDAWNPYSYAGVQLNIPIFAGNA